MISILPEMRELIIMSLNGFSDKDMLESGAYTLLEFYLGVMNASAWYELYIELTSIQEKKDLLNLPIFIY